MESPRTDTNSDATSQGVGASGGAVFTEAQLAAIGTVVQGLLDKARQSRGDSSGESGEFKKGKWGHGESVKAWENKKKIIIIT